SACSGSGSPSGGQIGTGPAPEAAPPPSAGDAFGTGPGKAAFVLSLSAAGHAGGGGPVLRHAAELAVGQFGADIQVLPRDDAGNASTAQQVSQKAVDDGAEIILGPLFAPSVQSVGQVARARNIPVIAFSTDASVAGRGVYLLSLLPESD